jgi:hypothetical protein
LMGVTYMTDFNLENFQTEVLHQYYVLKRVREKETEFINLPEILLDGQARGCLGQFFYEGAVKFARAGLGLANKGRDAAMQLLSNDKIRAIICSILLLTTRNEDLGEKQLIREIVNTLTKDSVIDEFSIPLDAEFFGFLCDEILHNSIEDYCRGV